MLVALLLSSGCSAPQSSTPSAPREASSSFSPRLKVRQVETPALIDELSLWLDTYVPQVSIRQPKADQVMNDTSVSVALDVRDLPIYRDDAWGMGPYVQLLLDNQPYDALYDISEPIVLKDLTPGTHTLRVFAMRPWGESFKNEGAYAQVTFHLFSKTDENSPVVEQPVLTYVTPVGVYGAQPILLDFYLTDAPLHEVAQDNPSISDWQIRYTINGESFVVKDWEPLYVDGLKSGKNWVQLTLVDEEENPIQGVFNNTVRLIEYDPSLNDSLAKIVLGEVTIEEIGGIIDPTYEPPAPETPAQSGAEPEPDEAASPEAVDADVAEPIEVTESEELKPENSVSDKADAQVIDDESKDAEQPSGQASDELTRAAESENSFQESVLKVPSEPENQSVEDEYIDETVSLEPVSDPDEPDFLEPVSGPDFDADDDIMSVPEVDDGSDSSTADSIGEVPESDSAAPSIDLLDEITAPSNQRYLKRLYDYRQRSMETYGSDRN